MKFPENYKPEIDDILVGLMGINRNWRINRIHPVDYNFFQVRYVQKISNEISLEEKTVIEGGWYNHINFNGLYEEKKEKFPMTIKQFRESRNV